MKETSKNILYIIGVILVTILTMVIVFSIPGYLREPGPEHIPMQSGLIFVFIIAILFLIGIPAGIHKLYVKDYSRIKSWIFFAIFGGITGGLLGERQLIMILPYTILMLIYAFLYKKFPWWKVALTTYLAGVLIENVMNHSPLQAPTILWVSFFIYPYFITKIFENRKKLEFFKIIKDFKYSYVATIILLILIKFIVKSLPVAFIILAIVIPISISIIYKLVKKRKK